MSPLTILNFSCRIKRISFFYYYYRIGCKIIVISCTASPQPKKLRKRNNTPELKIGNPLIYLPFVFVWVSISKLMIFIGFRHDPGPGPSLLAKRQWINTNRDNKIAMKIKKIKRFFISWWRYKSQAGKKKEEIRNNYYLSFIGWSL